MGGSAGRKGALISGSLPRQDDEAASLHPTAATCSVRRGSSVEGRRGKCCRHPNSGGALESCHLCRVEDRTGVAKQGLRALDPIRATARKPVVRSRCSLLHGEATLQQGKFGNSEVFPSCKFRPHSLPVGYGATFFGR